MKNSATKEIFVGIGVLAAFVAVLLYLYGGRALTAQAASKDYRVSAAFNKVDGLIPGDAVRLGGVKIGTVEKQELRKNFRAVLTFKISGNVRLPTDTSAAIHTDGLFGSKFVVLEPGGSEKYLRDGGEISFTQDAVIVTELLDLIISQGKANLKKLEQQKNEEKKR
ncbi:MAG: outer membrane lipid asymmetry maintenance protein MlaD [Rhodospirillales bacterium]